MMIPYALVKNEEGYLKEVVITFDLDSLPVVGDIIDINGKLYEFYNLSRYETKPSKYALIINGELRKVSKKETVPKLKKLVTQLVQLAENSNSQNLTHKRGTDLSEIEVIRLALKIKFSLKMPISSEIFSEERYKEIQNELVMYNNVMDKPVHDFINNLIYGINTILAVEGKIIPSKTGHFCYSLNDNDPAKDFLNYRGASLCIAEMLDRGHVIRKLRK